MLRIGGAVRGFLLAADELPTGIGIPVSSPAQSLAPGLWFLPMSQAWAHALDLEDGRVPGQPMVGFELLTAGVIAWAEGISHQHVVAYVERTFGLQLVDCAVAWAAGRIEAGPSGSAVTAVSERSAVNDVLDALHIDPSDQPAVLTALADSGH